MKRENTAGTEYSERLFSVSDADDGFSAVTKTDVGGIVNSVYGILKEKGISETENICDLLGKLLTSRPRLFYGKMTMNNKGRYGVSFKGMNLIPGLYFHNTVCPSLVSFCGDGDDFGYRMFETVTRVYRDNGAHRTVVMLTALWDQSVYRRVATDIERQKALFGTEYVFVLISDKGAAEIRV